MEYTSTSTNDLNDDTSGISFDVYISGDNVILSSVITTGTWNVKIGCRMI